MKHFSHLDAPLPRAYGPYSHSVVAGDFVFVAGQTAREAATGSIIDGDLAAQTARCLEIIRDILQEHALSLRDVVRSTVFLAHMEDFDVMNNVYGATFEAPYPVRSTVEVRMPFGALVGIEVTAFRGRSTNATTSAADDTWSVLADVATRSQAYLRAIGERRVSPSADALEGLKHFDIALPAVGVSPSEIVKELDRFAAPATVANAGRRYFGFVNGGALPAAMAANWLATAWDQHGSFNVGSPESSAIERIALRWVVELLGLPPESQGGFATGTTTAHIACLAAARSSLLSHVGWDAEADGLFGAPPVTVVLGGEVHSTLLKALGVVGLGRRRTVTVPADSQGRMRADALPALTGPTILCLQAGNVNSGSFDPFRDIIGRARASGVPLWVHIDGAFGLWARVAPTRAHLADGVELADSWATDGHKWLNTPYDCGVSIARDGAALRRALALSADYLPSALENHNPIDYTLESSRRARGLDIWAVLRSLGRTGLAEMVEHHCQLAKRFADGFVDAGFAVLNDVVLNQVVVTFGDAERTRRVIAAVQEDGTCWCGSTVWQGQTAMRVSVINWATTIDDVDRSLTTILRLAKSADLS